MLDAQELKKFLNLPDVFNNLTSREMKKSLDEYDEYRAFIVRMINRHGEDAYKNVDTYFSVTDDIKWEHFPKPVEEKFIAVIGDMCLEYCGNDKILDELQRR